MRRPLTVFVVASCLALCTGTLIAGPRLLPDRYSPGALDRDLSMTRQASPTTSTTVGEAGARIVSAWAYRNGAEFDVAVSYLEPNGVWSEPVFFGEDDGLNQIRPALAADEAGNLYLAYEQSPSGTILISALAAGSKTWTPPSAVSEVGVTSRMPSLRVVGERIVVAFHSRGGVTILDFPLLRGPTGGFNFVDGPDPIGGGSGTSSSSEEEEEDEDDGDTHGFGRG